MKFDMSNRPTILQGVSYVELKMIKGCGSSRGYQTIEFSLNSFLLLLGFTTLFNILGHQRRFRHRA